MLSGFFLENKIASTAFYNALYLCALIPSYVLSAHESQHSQIFIKMHRSEIYGGNECMKCHRKLISLGSRLPSLNDVAPWHSEFSAADGYSNASGQNITDRYCDGSEISADWDTDFGNATPFYQNSCYSRFPASNNSGQLIPAEYYSGRESAMMFQEYFDDNDADDGGRRIQPMQVNDILLETQQNGNAEFIMAQNNDEIPIVWEIKYKETFVAAHDGILHDHLICESCLLDRLSETDFFDITCDCQNCPKPFSYRAIVGHIVSVALSDPRCLGPHIASHDLITKALPMILSRGGVHTFVYSLRIPDLKNLKNFRLYCKSIIKRIEDSHNNEHSRADICIPLDFGSDDQNAQMSSNSDAQMSSNSDAQMSSNSDAQMSSNSNTIEVDPLLELTKLIDVLNILIRKLKRKERSEMMQENRDEVVYNNTVFRLYFKSLDFPHASSLVADYKEYINYVLYFRSPTKDQFCHAKVFSLLDEPDVPYYEMIKYLLPHIAQTVKQESYPQTINQESHPVKKYISKYRADLKETREHNELVLDYLICFGYHPRIDVLHNIAQAYFEHPDLSVTHVYNFIVRHITHWLSGNPATKKNSVIMLQRILSKIKINYIPKDFDFQVILNIQFYINAYPEVSHALTEIKNNIIARSFQLKIEFCEVVQNKLREIKKTRDFVSLESALLYIKVRLRNNDKYPFFKIFYLICDDPDMRAVYLPELIEHDAIRVEDPLKKIVSYVWSTDKFIVSFLNTVVFYLIRKFNNLDCGPAPLQQFDYCNPALFEQFERDNTVLLRQFGHKFIGVVENYSKIMKKFMNRISKLLLSKNKVSYDVYHTDDPTVLHDALVVYAYTSYFNACVEYYWPVITVSYLRLSSSISTRKRPNLPVNVPSSAAADEQFHAAANSFTLPSNCTELFLKMPSLSEFKVSLPVLPLNDHLKMLKCLCRDYRNATLAVALRDLDTVIQNLFHKLIEGNQTSVPGVEMIYMNQMIKELLELNKDILYIFGKCLRGGLGYFEMLMKIYIEYQYALEKIRISQEYNARFFFLNTKKMKKTFYVVYYTYFSKEDGRRMPEMLPQFESFAEVKSFFSRILRNLIWFGYEIHLDPCFFDNRIYPLITEVIIEAGKQFVSRPEHRMNVYEMSLLTLQELFRRA